MRIAIVNDLRIAVEALKRVLSTVPEYQIAWVAFDGAEAVEKCIADPPDLILMDLLMPRMDGVEATRQIMARSPCAILVVTATVTGNAGKVFEAMGHGALDAVNTPILGAQGDPEGGSRLLAKIATLRKLIGKSSTSATPKASMPSSRMPPLLAIGSSTGGPQALAAVLSRLPSDLPAAVVIVQHVDEQFASGLAEWLNGQTRLPVKLATAHTVPEAGVVAIASTNDHLILQSNLAFAYTAEPREYPYRPSVDTFFQSVARHYRGGGVGVLLTGMGRDGAEGLLALRMRGWHTIAQDQTTSVVYGMPKAAAELGAAIEILPLQEITASCLRHLPLASARR